MRVGTHAITHVTRHAKIECADFGIEISASPLTYDDGTDLDTSSLIEFDTWLDVARVIHALFEHCDNVQFPHDVDELRQLNKLAAGIQNRAVDLGLTTIEATHEAMADVHALRFEPTDDGRHVRCTNCGEMLQLHWDAHRTHIAPCRSLPPVD